MQKWAAWDEAWRGITGACENSENLMFGVYSLSRAMDTWAVQILLVPGSLSIGGGRQHAWDL